MTFDPDRQLPDPAAYEPRTETVRVTVTVTVDVTIYPDDDEMDGTAVRLVEAALSDADPFGDDTRFDNLDIEVTT